MDKSVKESAGVIAQLESTRVSDNDSFNKSLYKSVQNIEDGGAAWYAKDEIMQNLKDYASGIQDVKPSWMVSNDKIHSDKELTRSQINSIDFSDFISKMVSGFSSQLSDASKAQDEVKKQYQNIELLEFKNSHDRFLIIDKKEIFHIGASLKDLAKKWFAFSKINLEIAELLKKLK